MNILKNFRNPWEAATEVLKTSVLDSKVLETGVLEGSVLGDILTDFITDNEVDNDLNPYRGYLFTAEGALIARFRFTQPSGKILIIESGISQKLKKESKNQVEYFKKLKEKALTINKFRENNKVTSESLSKIYTTVLETHDYDLSKLYNNKLSIYSSGSWEDYNDPVRQDYATTLHLSQGLFKITFGAQHALDDFIYVGNVISAIGAHEYEGHGIEKWSGNEPGQTHYLAYKHQIEHKSFQYTTESFKKTIIQEYIELVSYNVNPQFWDFYCPLKRKYGKQFPDLFTQTAPNC